jgi:hypothetical protein
MKNKRLLPRISLMFLVGVGFLSGGQAAAGEPPQGAGAKISVLIGTEAAPRIVFGAEKLSEALKSAGYQPAIVTQSDLPPDRPLVVAARSGSALGERLAALGLKPADTPPKPQGFVLSSLGGGLIGVVGRDDSGTLYGMLELAGRVKSAGKLPADLQAADAPVLLMRGPCIGLQKSQWIYEGAQYDFPITPQNFPFFYDKPQWRKYLDVMVEHRMNMLTLWNGHPFTSLLELPKFPDARELDEDTLARNIEIFTWLTREADRRGIWVVQFFYNIHLSHALVKNRKIQTLSGKSLHFNLDRPTPLASEYTRYCISEFIREYPNVGLMMCLGEPLKDEFDAQWLTETILPGVRDGMQAIGLKDEPPVIIRAHSTEPKSVVTAALKTYKNIFTMAKFNDESLITPHPAGAFRQKHQDLIKLGSLHIMNVHLLHNLQPFRYGSPVFIQKSVKDMCDMGVKGLHVYPLNYWGWPDTPDKTTPRIHQLERDWIWFAAWARYAWNPDRGEAEERKYWAARLAERFGCPQAGEKLLDAYAASGVCLPRMHGRFGTGSGGYQIFTKGMTVPQLMFPERFRAYTDESSCRLEGGESLETYAAREWNRQPHAGETPPLALDYVLTNARRALAAADAAAAQVTRNREEFLRLRNDLNCILILTEYYAARIEAGLMVLRYGYSLDAADLAKALPLLEKSVGDYRRLASLTASSYFYANSLQTHNVTVPFSCEGGKNAHWQECLPYYEAELAAFKASVKKIEAAPATPAPAGSALDKPLLPADQLVKLFEPEEGHR